MRVIAGKARRLNLKSAPGLDTRPTTDRIKETLFNILNPCIPGCNFLDLFSGSGSIGIEALSRGAEFAAFVENNSKAAACIEENLEHTRLRQSALVLKKNVLSGINELAIRKYHFDIVFIDPPYKLGLEEETLNALSKSGIIDKESLIIIETDKKNGLEFINLSDFEIVREKTYKTNKHCFIKLRS